jgi:hypothetical protein
MATFCIAFYASFLSMKPIAGGATPTAGQQQPFYSRFTACLNLTVMFFSENYSGS